MAALIDARTPMPIKRRYHEAVVEEDLKERMSHKFMLT
jgi:hypothetical protein